MKARNKGNNKQMMKKALICALVAAFSCPLHAQDEEPPKQVTIHLVEESTELPDNWYVGSVIPVNSAHFGAEFPGKLVHITEPGTQLKKGDVLFSQDAQLEQADVEVSQSLLSQEKANFEFLKKQKDRLTNLANDKSASQAELDEIEFRLKFSEARVAELKASLQANLLRLEKKTVRAPYDGMVAQKFLWEDEHADAGTEVLAYMDLSNTEVAARVPFVAAANLRVGQQGIVSFDGNDFRCPITKVIPVSYDATRMAEVRVGCEAALFIGSRVKVNLASGVDQPMMLVNKDSVLIFPSGNYLFRVNSDNTVTELKVELGRSIGNKVEIKSGLNVGDKLVLQGAETLMDGQKIIIL